MQEEVGTRERPRGAVASDYRAGPSPPGPATQIRGTQVHREGRLAMEGGQMALGAQRGMLADPRVQPPTLDS